MRLAPHEIDDLRGLALKAATEGDYNSYRILDQLLDAFEAEEYLEGRVEELEDEISRLERGYTHAKKGE